LLLEETIKHEEEYTLIKVYYNMRVDLEIKKHIEKKKTVKGGDYWQARQSQGCLQKYHTELGLCILGCN
jgi:hypothetical protein